MITVADIMALPAIRSFEVLAGVSPAQAMQRRVQNIVIMDTTPDADGYSDYRPGELVFTNLGFTQNDPEVLERSLCAILKRDISALAVRNISSLPIPDSALVASNESGTPLITFEGAFHEQVIFQGMALLERDKTDTDVSNLIDGLLQSRTPESIRETFYEAFKASGATIQCAALSLIAGDEASLYAQIDELTDVIASIRRDWRRIETAGVFRYHDRALMVVTYNRPPAAFQMQSDSEFMQLLQPHGRFVAGISEEIPLGQGDLAVREAFGALEAAKAAGHSILRWASMRVHAFQDAASNDRLISSTCELYRQMLADFDEQHDSDLLATARALADAGGDVREAAGELFQHPNTVRYRIRMLKAIFSMEDATDRELARFLMLVFLVE